MGAAFKTDLALSNLLDTNRPSTSSSTSNSTTDKLITALTGPLHTTVTITLPSSGTFSDTGDAKPQSLGLSIRTHLTPPTHGTAYTLTLPTPLSTLLFSSPTSKPLTFPSFSELTSYLNFLLSMDIAHRVIAAENEGWRGAEGEAEVSSTVEVGKRRRTKKVGIRVGEGKEGELVVWWRWAEMVGKAEEVRWDGSGQGERRGLREVVEGFMK